MAEPQPTARPPVSVVVPFFGDREAAAELLAAVRALELRPGDELIVADNTTERLVADLPDDGVSTVASTGERSSYHTRNLGADRASNEWLLFMDSDCRPPTDLIDRYFSEPIPDTTALVAGPVRPLTRRDGLISRYAASRMEDEQVWHLGNAYRPFAATANVLVRRRAFEQVGGFMEAVRSGGDADFCWRLQAAGWRLGYRPSAAVRHYMREDLRSYLRVHARYTSGRHWLMRRWPDSDMGPKVQRMFRLAAVGAVRTLQGRFERALFNGIDVLVVLAEGVGYLFGNRPPPIDPRAASRAEVAVMIDRFPEVSETFVVNEVRALIRAGVGVRVEARMRPRRPAFGATWGLDVVYEEDTGAIRMVADWLWLLSRHPVRSVGDLLARRRWALAEPVPKLRTLAPLARRLRRDRVRHLHVHFARESALAALRLRHLIGTPYSLAAHAWDIYKAPTNLVEKLEAADFVATDSYYNVRRLRGLVGSATGARIHKHVLGVDPEEFRRRTPSVDDGTVIAVARLVEKKGLDHLISAAARLADFDRLNEVLIVGDGRLEERLREQAARLGVGDKVSFLGAKRPSEVKTLMERAAVLVAPSVVAPDGDRDGLPVVVSEALAMQLPVVASAEVGLPEVVSHEWGRLVPPGDPEALADAIKTLLELSPAERELMGAKGRAFIERECSIDTATRKLVELIGPLR